VLDRCIMVFVVVSWDVWCCRFCGLVWVLVSDMNMVRWLVFLRVDLMVGVSSVVGLGCVL